MLPFSIYIHIPFCRHRCGYCDFNTYAGIEAIIPDYIQALVAELEYLSVRSSERLVVHSIFFGGGTPSLLPAEGLVAMLESLSSHFRLTDDVEITLEANPGTLAKDYLQELTKIGINRLSLGMQSAHPGELQLLERQHSYHDVINSIKWARQAGIGNINLDLIFGLPEQEFTNWQRSLDLAVDLHPEHLSLYALTLEHGTPFSSWTAKGILSTPDPDLAADMFEWAGERLAACGYHHYEISNWAASTHEIPSAPLKLRSCRHNLQYWNNLPYIGLGAGAHGYVAGYRTVNVLSPFAYIRRMLGKLQNSSFAESQSSISQNRPAVGDRIESGEIGEFPSSPATISALRIDRTTEMSETMIMGLRLVRDGVSNEAFTNRFGQKLEQVYPAQIERLISQGLLEWSTPDHLSLRLSQKGVLLANRVFVEFV